MLERFIFDTDPGVDDMLALLMLSKLTSIELVGITTVFGNASIETTTRNALILRDRFGLNCPVVRGCATPISGIVSDHNPSSIHGKTGLGDFDLGLPKGTEVVVSAAQFIIDEIQQHPH